jgi:hypothetical protein
LSKIQDTSRRFFEVSASEARFEHGAYLIDLPDLVNSAKKIFFSSSSAARLITSLI